MWRRVTAFLAIMMFAATAAGASAPELVQVPITEELALTGNLHLPDGAAEAPAVVLYPGSQASRNLPGLAEHLAGQGIVVLDLNKRGVAGSDGSWRDETIERQAEDALAAIRYLQGRDEVDSRRVGVVGHSQGGWVAQRAAAQSPDVAFVVLLAGPAQTVKEQILTDERNHLAGWGVPPQEVESRIEMFAQLLDAALTNPAVCGPQPHHYLCGLIGYDPAETLAGMRVPVLALFGERDPMVPPEYNEQRLIAALAHLGHGDLETRTFPEANHVFRASKTGLRDEYDRLPRDYVPEFLEVISAWILDFEPPG